MTWKTTDNCSIIFSNILIWIKPKLELRTCTEVELVNLWKLTIMVWANLHAKVSNELLEDKNCSGEAMRLTSFWKRILFFFLRFPESKNTHTGVHNFQGREKYNQTGNLQWQLPRSRLSQDLERAPQSLLSVLSLIMKS